MRPSQCVRQTVRPSPSIRECNAARKPKQLPTPELNHEKQTSTLAKVKSVIPLEASVLKVLLKNICSCI